MFDPMFAPGAIVIVGLGGTGAQIARIVCRIVYNMARNNLQTPAIHFFDPDTVEEKNVGRQLFSVGDIGKNKAEVVMRRFNMALGLSTVAHPYPYEARQYNTTSVLLVGAVDNEEARRALHDSVGGVYIDCGNHHASGQVVIGNTRNAGLVKPNDNGVYRYLPTATTVFPALLEPEPNKTEDVSCADLLAREEQHLLVNDQMAVIAGTYIYKLLYRQPIDTCMTFVSLESLSMRSVPVSDIHTYMEAVRA